MKSQFVIDLENLRDGSILFTEFSKNNRDRFMRMAGYFFHRYRVYELDIEDLVQEGMIEAWRRVDLWDSTRGTPLQRYVEYHVGERMYREINRTRGWINKKRSDPMTRVDLQPHDLYSVIDGSISPHDRLELELVASTLPSLIERQVTIGVGLGASLRSIAAHLYNDEDLRQEHGFQSRDHATRRVRSAIRSATKWLVCHQTETRVSTFLMTN